MNDSLIKATLKCVPILVLLAASAGAWAQGRSVSGTITDNENGESLPGVTIYNKTTGGGMVTNINGYYSLDVNDGDKLVFSFIGYESYTVTISGQSVIDLSLKPDVQSLEEVVVIGYGQVEKKDATGVVSEVNAKDFNQGVLTTPENLLAGKVAGVQISTGGGQPGAAASIRIRGGTSVNFSNEPLIVVDGVPIDSDGHNPGNSQRGRSALNFINPADIESMTVLKDASAAAIYGSRAANGVIIITTKTGESKKLRVSYDGSYTFSTVVGEPTFFDAAGFRDLVAFKEPDRVEDLGDANTDWLDEVTQTATGQRHLVTLSQAKGKNNFYVSGNFQKSEGVLRTSETQNTNLAARYERKLLNDNLKAKLNFKGGWSNDRYAAEVMNQALTFDPTQSPRNADGTFFEWNQKLATRNPVAQLEQTDEQGTINRYLINGQFEYTLPFYEDLSVNVNVSYDYQDGDRTRSLAAERADANFSDPPLGEFYFQEDFERTSRLVETFVNYRKDFEAIKSRVDVVGGYSYQQWDERFDFFELDSADIARGPDGNLNPSMLDENDSSILENRLISFFGRVNYTFNDKYLVTATLRRDGSTRFGPKNRWGLFPSLALAWRIIDEPFMSGASWISDLKLRWGYGVTGNQEIPDYQYVSLYELGQTDAAYLIDNQWVTTLRPTGADPDIRWEETVSWNGGIDFGFINGRINGSIDVYRKDTDGLLNRVIVDPGSNVRDVILSNVGFVRNEGIELGISSTIINTENLQWSASFNWSTNRNEVIETAGNGGDVIYERGNIQGDIGRTVQVVQAGLPIFSFRTFRQKYDEEGNPLRDFKDHDGNGTIDLLDIYEDLDGDGVITPNDRYVGENPAPKWTAGFTSNLNYKKFNLSFTFRGNFGNYAYNNSNSANNGFSMITTNQVLNNVHQDVLVTNFNQRQFDSDYFIEDASFVKLDNISLGYTLDQLKQATVRLYVTMQNVWTITNYSGLDPEISLLGDGLNTNGIDNNLYPRAFTTILGANVTF
ncbi:MAG: TonB-dependent receptor [Bacteroidota bacterium]